jgi:hypothetical protein
MAMPKATVNENDGAFRWQDNIWASGQVSSMQPKSVAHGVERPSNDQFGLRVDATYATHESAAFLWRQDVGHPRPRVCETGSVQWDCT